MKLIVAFVQRHRLDPVTRALEHLPHFHGMTVTESRGFGREKLEHEAGDRRAELTDYTDNVRIEVVTHDAGVDAVLKAITDAAHTGQRGDGKIFVLHVERAVRIKTREEGVDAV